MCGAGALAHEVGVLHPGGQKSLRVGREAPHRPPCAGEYGQHQQPAENRPFGEGGVHLVPPAEEPRQAHTRPRRHLENRQDGQDADGGVVLVVAAAPLVPEEEPEKWGGGQGGQRRRQQAHRHQGEHELPDTVGFGRRHQQLDHLLRVAHLPAQLFLAPGRGAHDVPVVGDHILRLLPGEPPAGGPLQPGHVILFHGDTLLPLMQKILLLKI